MTQPSIRPTRLTSRAGYSLVMVSVLLTAGALVAVSMLPGGDTGSATKKATGTIEKLSKVEQGMAGFIAANGRRPCPADGQYATSQHEFGLEAANQGSCTGGSPAAPLGPDSTTYIVAGTIPTKTLNLPDDYAFDEWGRRVTYVLDKRATSAAACATLQNAPTNDGVGGLVIRNGAGTTVDNVMYAYISHGKDGHGAWPTQGSSLTGRVNNGSTDAATLDNASVNTSFGTSFDNILVRKSPTSTFDDIIYYRQDLKNRCCTGTSCAGAPPSGASCTLPWGGTIADGATVTAYSTGTEAYTGDGICNTSEVRTCNNGTLSGTYTNQACTEDPPANCTKPWGGTLNHGSTVSAYSTASVVTPSTCPAANTLSCTNGTLGCSDPAAGACQYQACTVLPGSTSCALPWGGIMPTGTSVNAYSVGSVTSPSVCPAPTSRTCTNGTLSGTGDYKDCNVLPAGGSSSSCIRFDGEPASGSSGGAIATGDVNGDGRADLIILASPGGNPGSVYVLFGKVAGGWSTPNTLDTTFLNGGGTAANGFRLDGATTTDYLSGVGAGDINGDGKADIIIGADNGGGGKGYIYVVFGKASGWATSYTLNTGAGTLIDGTQGFRLDGVSAGDYLGTITVGNVNGDVNGSYPIDDLILGAWGLNTGSGKSMAGAVYVVLGKTGAWSATQVLTTGAGTLIDGTKGFRLDGPTKDDYTGGSLAAGDINGDGKTDIVIGAYYAHYSMACSATGGSCPGAAYVVFGGGSAGAPKKKDGTSWSATNSLLSTGTTINGTNGFRLDGATNSENVGYSVAAGDVNGDGKKDLVIGANQASYVATQGGAVYVVLGKTTAWSSTLSLTATGGSPILDGTQGYRFDEPVFNNIVGSRVVLLCPRPDWP